MVARVTMTDGVGGKSRLERGAERGGAHVGRQEGRVEQGGQRDVGDGRRLRGNRQVNDGMLVSGGGDREAVIDAHLVRQVEEEKGDGGGHGETGGQIVTVWGEQTDLRARRHDVSCEVDGVTNDNDDDD